MTESETSITRFSFPRNLELYVFLGVNKGVINLNFFESNGSTFFSRFFKRVTAKEKWNGISRSKNRATNKANLKFVSLKATSQTAPN